MISKKTKFFVGFFLIMGITLAVIGIIWLGMSHYFERGRRFVCYFDESVQGLEKDSPVKYRGVPIGRVKTVGLAPDSKLVEVLLSIDTNLEFEADMYAQLKSVGITGIMFIEIDRKKMDVPGFPPPVSFDSEYPVIPTKPSGMKMFVEGMEAVRDMISRLEALGLSEKLETSLAKLNRALDSFDRTVTNIDGVVSANRENLAKSVSGLNQAIGNANRFLDNGARVLNASGTQLNQLRQHLLTTLKNLEKASERLGEFAEIISDQPSQLVFGEPPPGRKFGSER